MLSIVPVQQTDIDALLYLSRKTFYDTFYHLTKASDYEAYTSKAFTAEKLLAEMNHPNSMFYFALIDGEPAGYLKLNINDDLAEKGSQGFIEIERIYVLEVYLRQKIGKELIDFAYK